MPVTIKPSPQRVGFNVDPTVHSAEALLLNTSLAWAPKYERLSWLTREQQYPERRAILRSSFDDLKGSHFDVDSAKAYSVIPYGNGLVEGIIRAFQQDLHLVLRPDDVWLSILTQFSLYVNANAEELRSLFVTHEGKKELVVDALPYSVASLDFGQLSQSMTTLISENTMDPKLKDWIMPQFTTTTHNDKSVAAMVMMGTLQKYFDYIMRCGCGFPSVTLMGEPSDWQDILRRVEDLPKYGREAEEWSKLLIPVIKRFIATFSIPESQELKDFWLRVCHSAGVDGSGDARTYSGWITAFCFWHKEEWSHGETKRVRNLDPNLNGTDRQQLVLDDVAYPVIMPKCIPDGVVSVPVIVKDFGKGLEYSTTCVAGSVGLEGIPCGGKLTTVQPRSGWWMLLDTVKEL